MSSTCLLPGNGVNTRGTGTAEIDPTVEGWCAKLTFNVRPNPQKKARRRNGGEGAPLSEQDFLVYYKANTQ